MPLLADIYSRSDAFKRKLIDALRNPRDTAAQMWGDANDRARVLNEMTAASAQQPNFSNPTTMALATKLAEGYNPVGMVTGPQSQALETARKNAVKMLGLPENNTAMDRAKAMGFEGEWFRGDFPNLKAFQDTSGARVAGNTFLSSNQSLASRYARTGKPYNMMSPPSTELEGLYSTLVRRGNGMDIDARGEPWSDIPVPKSMKKQFWRGVGQIDDVAVAAKEKGYDSLLVKDVLDQFGSGDQLVVFNPARIRSRFAAFDPARVNENDLLAGMIPLGALAGTDEAKEKANKMVEALRRKKPD